MVRSSGRPIGPDPADEGEHSMTDADSATAVASDGPGGLAVSRDGYTLDLRTPVVDAAVPAELELVIEGPDGIALTAYEIEHDKELHLVVVGRDLAHYAHVHPARDADGRWVVEVPPMPAGSYRVFADFTPTGAAGLTLGADLTVPGDNAPVPLPPPSSTTVVDGYEVTIDGTLVAGTESELAVTVTRDGAPVTDLDPYLGALGHLVAIRNGDLAYLHVHPIENDDERRWADGPVRRRGPDRRDLRAVLRLLPRFDRADGERHRLGQRCDEQLAATAGRARRRAR